MIKNDAKLLRQMIFVVLLLVVCGSLYFLLYKSPAAKDTIGTLVNQPTAGTTTGDTLSPAQSSEQGAAPSVAADSNQTSGDTQTDASTTDSTVSSSTDAANSNGTDSETTLGALTLTSLAEVKDGLTYPQVTSIIGSPVKLVSEYGVKGTPERTASYLYRNDSQKIEAIVVYKAGKVSEKMEITLGESNQ